MFDLDLDPWPRVPGARRMRELISKALNLGAEYAEAKGEVEDVTAARRRKRQPGEAKNPTDSLLERLQTNPTRGKLRNVSQRMWASIWFRFFPQLVLKRIYHNWKYVYFFPGDLSKWRSRPSQWVHLTLFSWWLSLYFSGGPKSVHCFWGLVTGQVRKPHPTPGPPPNQSKEAEKC